MHGKPVSRSPRRTPNARPADTPVSAQRHYTQERLKAGSPSPETSWTILRRGKKVGSSRSQPILALKRPIPSPCDLEGAMYTLRHYLALWALIALGCAVIVALA